MRLPLVMRSVPGSKKGLSTRTRGKGERSVLRPWRSSRMDAVACHHGSFRAGRDRVQHGLRVAGHFHAAPLLDQLAFGADQEGAAVDAEVFAAVQLFLAD